VTPAKRAKARALCEAATARASLMIGKYPVTDMDGVRCALDAQELYTIVAAALSDLDRLTESRDDAMRLHRAAVVQRENLRRILQETVGAFVLHGYDVARILGSELAAEVELEAEHDGTAPKGGTDG
jgi:hypothetical protein